MRCSASPTTSTAVDPARHPDAVAVSALEAIVFREILKPLTAGLGPMADIAAAPIADKLAGVGQR